MNGDDNVDPVIKEFADLYGLKIRFGQIARPYWIQDDQLWETILASLEAKIATREVHKKLYESLSALKKLYGEEN